MLFPHDELRILDYNRTVKDLNGRSLTQFLEEISKNFIVEKAEGQVRPEKKGTFGMYTEGQWYHLTAKPELLKEKMR